MEVRMMTAVQFGDVRTYWEPGAPEPPKRGLFDVAEVVDVADPHLFLGVEYSTNRCTVGSPWLDMCNTAGVKTFNRLSNADGAGFAVYDSLECEIGESVSELGDRLTASFDVKAEAVAEARLQAVLTAAASTPATDLVDAVGLLEEALADGYAGGGLIHMDRYTSVRAGSSMLVDSGTGATVNGTPVVMGRGYSRGAGKLFAAASGRVVVLRGPAVVSTAPITESLPARVLMERQFVVVAECVAAWTEAGV